MGDIQLSGLFIYPIKSARGIALGQANVTARGLLHDRRWMVCDRSGKFLTQRKHPHMALIQVSCSDTHLTLEAPDQERLTVPIPATAPSVTVTVWGDRCEALPTADSAHRWLSQFLGLDCQLVYMPEGTQRPADHGTAPGINSFADAYPFLLISEASLADLNQRLAQPVPMNRFRPNLVVKGCDPFAEDSWRQIKIGNILFDVAKPCSRCSIPGVDQATGKQGKEPLATLARYRRWDGAIWFGQNLIPQTTGQLSLGDGCEVIA